MRWRKQGRNDYTGDGSELILPGGGMISARRDGGYFDFNTLHANGAHVYLDMRQVTGFSEGANVDVVDNLGTLGAAAGSTIQATQHDASRRPIYRAAGINGLPALELDSTHYAMRTTFSMPPVNGWVDATGRKFTHAMVVQLTQVKAEYCTFYGHSTNGQNAVGIQGGQRATAMSYWGYDWQIDASPTFFQTGVPYRLIWSIDILDSGSEDILFYVNGAKKTSYSIGAPQDILSGTNIQRGVGSAFGAPESSSTGRLFGLMSFQVGYQDRFTDQQCLDLDALMASEFGF